VKATDERRDEGVVAGVLVAGEDDGEDDGDDAGGAVVPFEPVEPEPEALVGAAGRRQPVTVSVAAAAAAAMTRRDPHLCTPGL